MRDKALSEDEVMRILEKTRERDYSYDRFFSTMCTLPHPIAVRAHDMFLETNLGDPGLFPGVAELEERVVQMLGEMLGCPDARGYISTGGTESNIQAIRAARNEAGKKNGNIVVPASAHHSFNMFGHFANITASQCLIVRQAQLHAEGKLTDAHAALAHPVFQAMVEAHLQLFEQCAGAGGDVEATVDRVSD